MQVHLELEPVGDLLVHVRLEPDEAVLAGRLGPVEGDVGVTQQVLGVRPWPEGDPQGGGDEQRRPVITEMERLTQHGEQPPGDQLRTRRHGGTLHEDHEFVASETPHAVRPPHGGGEPFGHAPQQLVAGTVPEAVVDLLEVVKVEEHGGDRLPGPAPAGEHLLRAVEDQGPVRQAGERVVQRLEPELTGPLVDQAQRPTRERPKTSNTTKNRMATRRPRPPMTRAWFHGFPCSASVIRMLHRPWSTVVAWTSERRHPVARSPGTPPRWRDQAPRWTIEAVDVAGPGPARSRGASGR